MTNFNAFNRRYSGQDELAIDENP